MAVTDPCHDATTSSYDACIQNAFDFGGGLGLPDVFDFHALLAGLAGVACLLSAAWMLSEVYTTWASGKRNTSFLINTPIRIIMITTITMYLIFNT